VSFFYQLLHFFLARRGFEERERLMQQSVRK
jgi:hypothetical protein